MLYMRHPYGVLTRHEMSAVSFCRARCFAACRRSRARSRPAAPAVGCRSLVAGRSSIAAKQSTKFTTANDKQREIEAGHSDCHKISKLS